MRLVEFIRIENENLNNNANYKRDDIEEEIRDYSLGELFKELKEFFFVNI